MDWKEHHELRKQEGRLDLDFKTLGEAMRPENLRGEAFRLSREERDHIAGHALDSIQDLALALANTLGEPIDQGGACSGYARKVAVLSNLLDDIGWEREGEDYRIESGIPAQYRLGGLSQLPVAQLGPWLEEWQRQDDEALVEVEGTLKAWEAMSGIERSPAQGQAAEDRVVVAQTKLGTGAILLARLEKWMASHGN